MHTREEKQKYQCLNNSTLIDIILDKEDELYSANQVINELLDVHKENDKLKEQIKKDNHILGCNFAQKDKLRIQISTRREEYLKLERKLRHIEQYFDDLDDIDYKTIKYEVEKILNE